MSKYRKIKTEDLCVFVGNNVNDVLALSMDNIRSFKSFNIKRETVSYKEEVRGLFNIKTMVNKTKDVNIPQIPEFMVVEEVITGKEIYDRYFIDVITKKKIVLRINYFSGNGVFLNTVFCGEYDDGYDHRGFYAYPINGQEANEILSEWANKEKNCLERWAKFINLANTVFENHKIKKNDEATQTENLIDELNKKMENYTYKK